MEKLLIDNFSNSELRDIGKIWGGQGNCECYTQVFIETTPELCNDVYFECDDNLPAARR